MNSRYLSRSILLALTLLLLTPAISPAQSFADLASRKKAPNISMTAGLIGADGTILGGTGFTGGHSGDGPGEYIFNFPKGSFRHSPPAFVCTPNAIATLLVICTVSSSEKVGASSYLVDFRLYSRSGGKLTDNAFTFIEVTPQ